MSVATPLTHGATGFTLWQLFSGDIPGMIGETSKLTLLLGGVYLLVRRVIDWRIPLTFHRHGGGCVFHQDRNAVLG